MLDPVDFFEALRDAGVEYFAGVPDSLLTSFCSCVSERLPAERHVICANEGAAVAMAIGYHLATGKVPAVYMQNSGLGNAINPLLSLADPEVYSIPIVLIIGWRGQPGVKDEPQHVKQGRVTRNMLDAMEIPTLLLGDGSFGGRETIERLQDHFARHLAPLALLVPKGSFGKYERAAAASDYGLTREEAIEYITLALYPRDLVVSTTGMASRELYEIREARGEEHGGDFMLVGGMGHTGAVALGVAQSHPERRVVCLDGDGSVLMHMGSLAIAGQSGCRNFRHIVVNNGAHDSVGGQPTVGFDIDLCEVARALGYDNVARCSSVQDLDQTLDTFLRTESIGFLEIRVRTGNRRDLGRPKTTPKANKKAFMEFAKSA